jgi:hypothetical protein
MTFANGTRGIALAQPHPSQRHFGLGIHGLDDRGEHSIKRSLLCQRQQDWRKKRQGRWRLMKLPDFRLRSHGSG